jgi:iron uptake system component EfeO
VHRRAKTLIAAALLLTAAACGSSSKPSSSGNGSKAPTIAVTITPDGCRPATITADAGPATFEIQNDGADGITEAELTRDGHIVGEKENLTPGLTGSFTVTLQPGDYEMECPGGKSAKVTVTGPATTTAAAGSATTEAVQSYKTYVSEQATLLVEETKEFAEAVENGDVAKAKSEFAETRAPYERIEPVAESLGDLDPAVDAREGDVPDAEWGGFHRIEKQLWSAGNTTGMTPVARELVADVETLRDEVPSLQLEPAQIANGAVELLNEVSKSKITGEEDRYSHTDLSDFDANVEGARQAFGALRPLVAAKDKALSGELDARFDAVTKALEAYESHDVFVSYTTLTKDDTRMLASKVDALADSLAKIAPLVVGP